MGELEQFIQGFIDEANQLCDDLEGLLVGINESEISDEQVQEIFRIMHTIKGSSAMFAFNNTEKITHLLEDIYDLIREKQLQINQEIVSLTLEAGDFIKELLHAHDKLDNDQEIKYNEYITKIGEFVPRLDDKETTEGVNEADNENISSEGEKYFYIMFKPDSDVLQRGLNVPNVFEELYDLGEVNGIPHLDDLPDAENFDPAVFYLSWDLFIKTQEPFDEIQDCFMFYSDHEYLVIDLKDKDLSNNKIFNEKCIALNKGTKNIEQLQQYFNVLVSGAGTKANNNESAELKKDIETEEKPESTKKTAKQSNTIKVDAEKLDELVNLVSDLVTLNSQLEVHAKLLNNDSLKKTVKAVSKLSKRFRDNALELRLIPVKTLELKMQRLIRDLSKRLDKKVEFIVQGTKTELDKNIIARLEGPIMHILRNSLDHGLESTEERLAANKPEKGVVRFISFYSGSNVFIQIQDDGKGIDPEKIKQKAFEKGLIEKGAKLDASEVFNLLFMPGFSTATEVSAVSGRGVGLDVVKNEIMSMRGEIDIESEIGLGTSFTIKLPLTLSIIDTLMIGIGNNKLLIPREVVQQTKLIKSANVQSDTIEYNNKPIPVISLRNEFAEQESKQEKHHYIFINQNDGYYAILVDKIYGEYQAVVKPLGYYNTGHDYFSSASVMGDGSLALILDVAKLINSKKSNSSLGKHHLK